MSVLEFRHGREEPLEEPRSESDEVAADVGGGRLDAIRTAKLRLMVPPAPAARARFGLEAGALQAAR